MKVATLAACLLLAAGAKTTETTKPIYTMATVIDFDRIIKCIIEHNEGAYVNDPRDPGGETKYGISKKSYPKHDIFALTYEDAKHIYLRDFWAPLGLKQVNDITVAAHIMDSGINIGVRKTIKLVQSLIGVEVDGVCGPKTIEAINSKGKILASEIAWSRKIFYKSLNNRRYERGWLNRVDTITCLIK